MNFGDEFAGKRVVVTGAAGIMGRALVDTYAQAGAEVCSADMSDEGLSGFAVAADLTTDEGLKTLLDAVKDRWGAPDIVVNNAAIYPSAFLLDMSMDDWDRIMDLNVRAPVALMRGFALMMIEAKIPGCFVNISSGAARKMRRTAGTYSASKTALDRFTKGFALELAEFGILVNCLEPGFAAGSAVSALSQEHIQRVTNNIPLRRQTEAEDIGNAALYLSSQAARNVTGTSLAVDGGNSAGTMDVFQDKKSPL